VRVSAKVDYALRAAIELAVVAPQQVKGERLAATQVIPHKFLENILVDLRHAGLVASQRGAEGGYRLARDPSEINVADVIRAVEGPIASVRGESPDSIAYEGSAVPLRDVWIDLRTAMRGVLEQTTLAHLVERGKLLEPAPEPHPEPPASS
jgi:Rrf2 family protein